MFGFSRFVSLAGELVLTILLLFSSAGPAFAQRGVTVAFLPDATAAMDIREASSPEKAGEYRLYVPSFMAFSRLSDDFNGAVWLRIALASSFEKPVGSPQVTFGSALPGTARLYIPQGDGFAALESSPSAASFILSDTGKFPDVFYARIDGAPGLWFRPVLEGADAESSSLPPVYILLACLFAAAMLLLLLQYIREAEEWRLWAAITAGCGMVAAILPANPAAGAAYTPLMAAAMLIPGLLIVFFAHTARHLFNTPKNLPGYDALLLVYYVFGAVIALLPLIPGFLYVSRYLPLAFVIFVPLLFVAMVALGRSLRGSTAFLCGCLLTIVGVIGSAWELTVSGTPVVGDLGGLAGLGLGLVFLGLTGPAKQAGKEAAPEEDVFDSLDRSCAPAAMPEEEIAEAPEEVVAVAEPAEQPLAEPEAMPLGAPAPAITILDDVRLDEDHIEDIPVPERPAFTQPGFDETRKTLFDLPLLVKDAYDEIAPLAKKKNLALSWFIAPKTGRLFEGDKVLVDSALRMLLRDMVESMSKGNVRFNVRRLPDSKEAGHIVFTITEWDARKTFHARNMAGLSEAWALAEQTGGIFSVEHSPTSGTTVIFSTIFTAMDKPKVEEAQEKTEEAPKPAVPAAREEEASPPVPDVPAAIEESAIAPPAAEAPQKFVDHPNIALPDGLEIISVSPVSADVDGENLIEETEPERVSSHVIIADITSSGRARMRTAFADSPYSALESTSPQAAYALYKRNPSALVVMSGDMPEVDIAAAIQDMHAEDTDAERSPVPVLALVGYEAQAGRMAQLGCAKTLLKPVKNETMLAAALELAPLERYASIPVPTEALEPARPEELLPATEKPAPEAEVPAPAPEMVAEMRAEPEAGSLSAPEEIPAHAEAAQSGIFVAALPEDAKKIPAEPEKIEKKETKRGMGMINMIVTEEEEDAAEKTPEPVAKRELASAPEPQPATAKPFPQIKATVTVKPAKKMRALSLSDPEASLEDMPHSTTLVTDDGRPIQGGPTPSSGISIQLPGEEDSIFKDMMPLIPGLIYELTDAIADAARGREEKSPILVQKAAERVVGKAEEFGLTRLERMARCVERAAAADDVEPMECVLDDLVSWVERYKEALAKLHREYTW
jgi:CheY-like chemotaxis protein